MSDRNSELWGDEAEGISDGAIKLDPRDDPFYEMWVALGMPSPNAMSPDLLSSIPTGATITRIVYTMPDGTEREVAL